MAASMARGSVQPIDYMRNPNGPRRAPSPYRSLTGGLPGQTPMLPPPSSPVDPPGYHYDAQSNSYRKLPPAITPQSAATQAGQAANQFMTAAGGGNGGFGGGGGGAGSSFGGLLSAAGMGGSGGGGSIQPTAAVAPIDTTAADAAKFARARDQAGMTGRASLESLRGLMGETGQLGGGAEAAATRDIVQHAAGQMGEVGRDQAIQGTERNFQTALANQQSAVTQRGQDINAQEAQARLALAQTQLQSQRSLEMLRLALSQAATAGSLY